MDTLDRERALAEKSKGKRSRKRRFSVVEAATEAATAPEATVVILSNKGKYLAHRKVRSTSIDGRLRRVGL